MYRSCFVIMPFGEPFDGCYRNAIVPAIKANSLQAVRADDINIPGSIVHQIWEQIHKATICIADVTGKNANVMYEVGIAHALRKPTISLVQDVAELPFDLRGHRQVIYSITARGWRAKLTGLIKIAIEDTMNNPDSAQLFAEPSYLQVNGVQAAQIVRLHFASAAYKIARTIDKYIDRASTDATSLDSEDFFESVRAALLESRSYLNGFTTHKTGHLTEYLERIFPATSLRPHTDRVYHKLLDVGGSLVKRQQLFDIVIGIEEEVFARVLKDIKDA